LLTSDPIYNKPYKPQIFINNTANSTNYYTYDPWTDVGTTNKPTHLSLNLSENTHGKFVVQIEDGGRTLNRSNINKGARVLIKVGKQSSQMTQVLSGLIRETGDARGSDRKDLYTLVGSSTSIRNNERIIYYLKQAAKDNVGGINLSDASMKAITLLVNAYSGVNSINPSYGSESSLGIINLSNTAVNSTVNNFIADINIEFGEIQDLINLIEEMSSSEFNIDALDIANLRYELTRSAGGRGFTIKNKTYRITGMDDDADDTMYLIKKNWKYSDSCYKSDSYSNRLSGILPAEKEITTVQDFGFEAATYDLFVADTGKEIAVKFKPNHTRWFPGDFYYSVLVDNTSTQVNDQICRIVKDSGGLPQNAGGVVANIRLPITGLKLEHGLTVADLNKTSNEESFYSSAGINDASIINSFTLDTNLSYWFIFSVYGLANNTAGISSLGIGPLQIGATRSGSGVSTFSAGGSGWGLSGFNPFVPIVGMPRTRSQSIVMHDPKAIKNLGSGLVTGGQPIETHLPSFSSIIKTAISGYSYMANQLYYMAKPRANYNIPQVTAPNICPLPGDPIVISDTVMGFSTPGNKVIYTRCGDLSLSWGSLDGSGFTYEAPTKLSINPVGNIPRYK
jgi:hypothetical protein